MQFHSLSISAECVSSEEVAASTPMLSFPCQREAVSEEERTETGAMETGETIIADLEGKGEKPSVDEHEHKELQGRTKMPASGQSDFQSNSSDFEPDGSEDKLVNPNKEAPQNGAEFEHKQSSISKETIEKKSEASSSNGVRPTQEKDCPQEWGLDKPLPPIKVRREGQSRDTSPSDLSPPSPKRMRQLSEKTQESRHQWLGLWKADESK